MKKLFAAALLGGVGSLALASQGWALAPETELLLELLRTKGILSADEVEGLKHEVAAASQPAGEAASREHYHSVQSIDSRLRRLESAKEVEAGGGWAEKVQLSGVVEIESTAERLDDGAGRVESSSDLVLATAQVNLEARPAENVTSRLVILYEDGEDLAVDEAVVGFSGPESMPLYLNLGKMYLPFGRFESHFVSDPLTLELGETGEVAVVAGWSNSLFDLSLGAFNGDVEEAGEEDHIDGFVASGVFSLPADTIPGFGFEAGVSYITSLADSDGLEGEVVSNLTERVGGASVFAHATFGESFTLGAEYLGAFSSFGPGELAVETFPQPGRYSPRAWNLEAAWALLPAWELAVRYAGSHGAGLLLPERQYGVALLWAMGDTVSWGVEYLHGDWEDDSRSDGLTLQMALGF